MAVFELSDVKGVWPLLLLLSGYAAMERGSEWVEPQDLVKAIYVADLEHVVTCWDDWEGLEKFVAGSSNNYLNRTLYLFQVEKMRDQLEGAIEFAKLSESLQEVVGAARKLATDKIGAPGTLSSRILLFCVCSMDPILSEALQRSGLNLARLEAMIRNQRDSGN